MQSFSPRFATYRIQLGVRFPVPKLGARALTGLFLKDCRGILGVGVGVGVRELEHGAKLSKGSMRDG